MKCARYDDSCDCPACVDDRVKTYTTDDGGAEAGLPGWVRVLRHGQPVRYFRDQQTADAFIRHDAGHIRIADSLR